MPTDRRKKHQRQVDELAKSLAGNTERLRVKKKTISNLFRYEGRSPTPSREVDLRAFDQPLYLDKKNHTLDVQGLTTYEAIVDYVLPHGYTPVITPELKHITVGGAFVGIGIETNSFRFGFVHDSILEADVLLPSGEIVTCSPGGKNADLFFGLPNSYGTLGYILRVRLQLHPAKPYVHLRTERFHATKELVGAMERESKNSDNDYLESLFYSPSELYLTTARQTDQAGKLSGIYGKNIFYRQISRPGELRLTTKEYLFRYDPEWFWAMPEAGFHNLFRWLAPKRFRNSSFFTRYIAWQTKWGERLPFLNLVDETIEPLIQDWEVPWQHAQALLDFALANLDLNGKPLMTAPVKTPATASGYPMKSNHTYLNLGSYSLVKKKSGQPPYHSTKIMDEFCFSRGGIKMLYSSTFLSKKEFERIYDGSTYDKLKVKYDPNGLLPTLFEKAVKAR